MSEGLRWPPTKEDLRRLYEVEKLSAAKIAAVYGLRSPNPKSKETLVLYYLRKFGIKRRDRAEHTRKVTNQMVDEWIRRYQAGESLKQIAGSSVDAVTIWNYLRKRGIPLRDKVEAQIKAVSRYERRPFQADQLERAYMMGLRYGDLHVTEHGRAIRVRVSTTHLAMAELFESLFSPYGHVARYPRKAKLTGHEWSLECDLHPSFRFLLRKPSLHELEGMTDEVFLAFLSGLFDAEGSIQLHNKRGRHNPEVTISNADRGLLELLFSRIRRLGFSAHAIWRRQPNERGGVKGESEIGRVVVWKFKEVQDLLRLVHLRHGEKVSKAALVGQMRFGVADSEQPALIDAWRNLRASIKRQREDFLREAGATTPNRKESC